MERVMKFNCFGPRSILALLAVSAAALAAAAGAQTPAPAPPGTPQALTWDQVKAKFEATNPALKADADNVDEMRAEEITAYLRPNPQFDVDRRWNPNRSQRRHWQPLAGTFVSSPASATCTSATTNASCAWKARRKARAFPSRSMRT